MTGLTLAYYISNYCLASLSTFYFLLIGFNCTFFHLGYCNNIFLLLLYFFFFTWGSGWIIGVGLVSLGNSSTAAGRSDPQGDG